VRCRWRRSERHETNGADSAIPFHDSFFSLLIDCTRKHAPAWCGFSRRPGTTSAAVQPRFLRFPWFRGEGRRHRLSVAVSTRRVPPARYMRMVCRWPPGTTRSGSTHWRTVGAPVGRHSVSTPKSTTRMCSTSTLVRFKVLGRTCRGSLTTPGSRCNSEGRVSTRRRNASIAITTIPNRGSSQPCRAGSRRLESRGPGRWVPRWLL